LKKRTVWQEGRKKIGGRLQRKKRKKKPTRKSARKPHSKSKLVWGKNEMAGKTEIFEKRRQSRGRGSGKKTNYYEGSFKKLGPSTEGNRGASKLTSSRKTPQEAVRPIGGGGAGHRKGRCRRKRRAKTKEKSKEKLPKTRRGKHLKKKKPKKKLKKREMGEEATKEGTLIALEISGAARTWEKGLGKPAKKKKLDWRRIKKNCIAREKARHRARSEKKKKPRKRTPKKKKILQARRMR